LTRFPFDTIKIDKSFLAATRENTGVKILASIVSLAKELKLSVVAEGVETQEEAARLKEMGCEFGQGFLLGAPVPAAEINGVIVKAQAR
jgi:EAL domain-containing protein (putative c-di-GMP-specific phosphodiesterase class I)